MTTPFARTGIVAASIAIGIVMLVLAAMQTAPYESRGFAADGMSGRVTRVATESSAWKAGVRRGDTLLDPPRGNPARGYRLYFPASSDRFLIQTRHGIVSVAPDRYAPLSNAHHAYLWSDIAADVSVVIVLGFATLLFVRRPGPMAFSFWLYAASSWSFGQIAPLFQRLPPDFGEWVFPLIGGFLGFAFALPLIPFALRFPNDRESVPRAWWERVSWICYGIAVVVGLWYYAAVVLGSILPNALATAILYAVPALPLPIAAAILIVTFLRADQQLRAQTAWAVAGFLGAAAFTFVAANEVALFGPAGDYATVEFFYSAISILGNLFPLLAIYPILRFRLFGIRFVVSRATLYSVLTLAAFTTLAGVNWLAQRLVNDRVATVLQPLAAIVIGLGYFRVRGWTRDAIERILFRERLAAEREIDAMIAALPSARDVAAIGERLTVAAARCLSLQSAALFRVVDGGGLRRAASIGWDDESLAYVPSDDRLARSLEREQRVVSLRALGWDLPGEPAEPARPVAGLALRHGDGLLGVALYGRHRNGTEIDPSEITLLRRLCDAGAAAYDGAALRAENANLREQLAAQNASVPPFVM